MYTSKYNTSPESLTLSTELGSSSNLPESSNYAQIEKNRKEEFSRLKEKARLQNKNRGLPLNCIFDYPDKLDIVLDGLTKRKVKQNKEKKTKS